jgi:hypothetical protein
MAVPVINTVSRTKSTGLTKLHSSGHTVGAVTSTWTDITEAPELPNVVDGESVWLSCFSYGNTTNVHNNYEIRIVGVTSGSVLFSSQTFFTHPHTGANQNISQKFMGTEGVVKNTGATENVKLQFKNYGTSTAYFTGQYAWGTGIVKMIFARNYNTETKIRTTMQIDDIDIFCVNPDHDTQILCPEVGTTLSHFGGIQTLTPQRMVNSLTFIPIRLTTSGNSYPFTIVYSYTGKELVMS